MMRVLVTGSTQGLGRAAAKSLLDASHEVVVHARDTERLDALSDLLDRGAEVVVGDLSDLEETRQVADQVNELGRMDAVIHNAGVDSSGLLMPVNVVAPYVLTALMDRPNRLIYLSSRMHFGGKPNLAGIDWTGHKATGTYSDSKLFVTTLAFAFAERWPDVLVNAVDPGWVPTRMGGPDATGDLHLGQVTQTWLATSNDPAALTTGGYWYHQSQDEPHPDSHVRAFQQELLDALAATTGVALG